MTQTCQESQDEKNYNLSVQRISGLTVGTPGSYVLKFSENGKPVAIESATPFKNDTEYGYQAGGEKRVKISITRLQTHELTYPYVHGTVAVWLSDSTIYVPVICNTKPQ